MIDVCLIAMALLIPVAVLAYDRYTKRQNAREWVRLKREWREAHARRREVDALLAERLRKIYEDRSHD